jgi:hypothetical protein
MRAATRNALTAKEAFYADNGRYAKSLEEIGAARVVVGAEIGLSFFWTSKDSYAIAARHASTRVICVVVLASGYSGAGNAVCG